MRSSTSASAPDDFNTYFDVKSQTLLVGGRPMIVNGKKTQEFREYLLAKEEEIQRLIIQVGARLTDARKAGGENPSDEQRHLIKQRLDAFNVVLDARVIVMEHLSRVSV